MITEKYSSLYEVSKTPYTPNPDQTIRDQRLARIDYYRMMDGIRQEIEEKDAALAAQAAIIQEQDSIIREQVAKIKEQVAKIKEQISVTQELCSNSEELDSIIRERDSVIQELTFKIEVLEKYFSKQKPL